jgi:hypothetical protein
VNAGDGDVRTEIVQAQPFNPFAHLPPATADFKDRRARGQFLDVRDMCLVEVKHPGTSTDESGTLEHRRQSILHFVKRNIADFERNTLRIRKQGRSPAVAGELSPTVQATVALDRSFPANRTLQKLA